MAEVISFADVIRARRRARAREHGQRCVELIELNLRLALESFAAAPEDERLIRARRIRVLGELLEYALRAS
jgi:hypothetical protein